MQPRRHEDSNSWGKDPLEVCSSSRTEHSGKMDKNVTTAIQRKSVQQHCSTEPQTLQPSARTNRHITRLTVVSLRQSYCIKVNYILQMFKLLQIAVTQLLRSAGKLWKLDLKWRVCD